ncbi:protein KTI12 homolog [Tetranychus urticae]|uniref:Protein KTI12 homolog n=1 Tax=Tetranychus urticae TaxID=32264 RepID=T1KF55_TETUR|nr:protein KTI12 homolog [Tetranychus urticae]
MPLIVMVGLPCSGKSYWSQKLQNYFNEIGCQTIIISDNDYIDNVNHIYSDSNREKEIRGQLKSGVQRHLNKEKVVILDSSNYIKGFRYELFCLAKEQATTYCVVECANHKDKLKTINEARQNGKRYDDKIFNELFLRYEAPDSQNRWDSPYFVFSNLLEASFDDIKSAIIDKKPLKPNQSTQSQPLSEANFLYQLDSQTKEIVDFINKAQKGGPMYSMKIPGEKDVVKLNRILPPPELNRLRRSFIGYVKMHPIEKVEEIKATFIQYLNSVVAN